MLLDIRTRDQVAPVFRLPECAFHPDRFATVDASTAGGWGFLCTRCFLAMGQGLGTGLGQVLVPQEPAHHIDMEAPCHACGARWTNLSTGGSLRHTTDCLYNAAITAFPDLY